jgi:hypothetical protein
MSRREPSRVRTVLLRLALVTFAAVALVAGHGNPAWAGIGIAPSKVELVADPGETLEFEISFLNPENTAYDLSLGAWDFARDEQGRPYPIGAEDAEKFRGCSSWIALVEGNSSLQIPATTNHTSRFVMRVPEDAAEGTHYCYVEFTTTPASEASGSAKREVQTPVSYAMGALVLVTVGEEEGGEVPLLVQDVKVADFEIDEIVMSGRVPMNIRIANGGNVHANLKDGSGVVILRGDRVEAEIPFEEFTLLPGSTLALPATWEPTSPFGVYTARFVGELGLEEPLLAEASFRVLDWRLIAATIALLIALILSGVLFFRRFSIQLKPKEA